jgi:hypothetical protein
MISCTEFIPAYSEGFKYLEMISPSDEPGKFWNWLSENFLQGSLARLISDRGLEGCFEYWAHSLNEEAAGFKMTLDEIKGEFTIEMHKCPSKAMLNGMKNLEPYNSYCSHCSALYRPAAERYGYSYAEDLTGSSKASCRVIISIKRETNLNE